MLFYAILVVTLTLTSAEKFFQIEDIPIENFSFEQDDIQNDAMDIELMPRRSRSFPLSNEDPKQYFFSRSLYGDRSSNNLRDIPRPGGFSSYGEENDEGSVNVRHKREAIEPALLKRDGRQTKNIVKKLGKPLELAVIDPENITEKPVDINTDLPVSEEASETSNFLINDFIRFKRATAVEKMAEDVSRIKDLMKKIDDENKSKTSDFTEDPKSLVEEIPHTEKLVMESRDGNIEPMREARGLTKDQWVKQPYPVRRGEDFDDNSPALGDREFVRAPRVHFVTQSMAESAPRPEYNRYDREARVKSLNKELAWNLGRDPYREMDYYQPRYTRNYIPSSNPSYRNDRYFAYESKEPWDNYSRSRYDYPERSYDNYNNYSGSKGRQRRIIYYASLPEITRTPPNVDLRDKYGYRDRYQDRYFNQDSSYQLRKPYTKSRYEENDDRKSPPPLKVSTDVSVREVKKNPERRIYSEVERNRYPQSSPYQNERMHKF